ncbi:PREDICTED: max-binding protein MNT, partial [Nestor notabilis]|uniref:max-binding protein MNT n=1 Tax=Nestor notabilis TaxID=176057 RepID=UPI000523D071
LKRKEKEYEHEMERLAREKIATQQRLAELKNELSQWMDILEIDRIIRQTVQPEDDQASTSTASEGEDNMDEDMEDDRPVNSLPKLTQRQHPELLKATQALVQPQAIVPAQTHIVAASTVQSTVIAHTATTHASVIQTVNHVIQGPQTKHIAHIAPSTSSPVQLTTSLAQQAVMPKPAVGTQVVHHPQLVGQTVLNPVTMVTMPSFPVSTLKLA